MEERVEIKKPNIGEIAVGIDLTDSYSQISYGLVEGENVETLSNVSGSQNFRIPTVLFKRKEVNQWFFGKEAVKFKDEDGYFIDKLVTKAMTKETISVGEDVFEPQALLALFFKRILSLVGLVAPLNKIVSFMVTVNELDEKMVDVLSKAVASLGLKNAKIYFESHTESFYYYMIYQEPKLWRDNVLLLDFTGDCLRSYRMECNKNTTPVVAFIDSNVHHSFGMHNFDKTEPQSEAAAVYDEKLYSLVADLTDGRTFSSIFLIGDAFNKDIFVQTVKLLCAKGRVFEGNNLYSKGAAYGAKNKVVKTLLSESHVFLGNDKLKSNVGFNVLRRGENVYMPLLDAGVNWYEAGKECDIILDKGNKLSFVITPLTGKDPEIVDITLADLPKRPPKTTKLHISMNLLSETRLQVVIKDMGFGELFNASNIEWKEIINV